MDPIALILAALATGLQATASDAVKDAYTGLKTLLQRKFAGKPVAEVALAEHEKKPDIWKAPLAQGLQETEANQDQEIIAAAQRLIQLAHPSWEIKGPALSTSMALPKERSLAASSIRSHRPLVTFHQKNSHGRS